MQRLHKTPAHRRVRAVVLARDGHRCVYCGSVSDLTVDYVVPLSRGGELSVRNAVCACRSCNSSRGGKLSGGHNRLSER